MSDPTADCEALLNWLFPLAEELLEESAQFFPFGGAMTVEGALVPVGPEEGDSPDPADLVGLIQAGFVQGVAEQAFKATALMYDARVEQADANGNASAIVAELNHLGGYSVTVVFPYRIEQGVLTIDEPVAEPGRDDIFPRD